ncbi:cysteine hydrolase family protein [Arthrobacter roseus]|uniref:cysteine hydrolase family protein n=1 Tax=Arthrobacter roseus TaxID=136274 RepID=UPI0019640AE7|nr:cysteine hydrolase family protein [Arthrobacter roseus]MBM7846848.1 nicotinamidase-related amidase [Arthrobacter roseus]
MKTLHANAALVVIDVQRAFDDPYWGKSNNPACEENIASLIMAWESERRPIVVVRHDSKDAGSPLHPSADGNALKPFVAEAYPDLLVTKHVNSAFIGSPDLDSWLTEEGIRQIVVCGIQTNMCVETTSRMGGNLGYEVIFPLDATRTFDMVGPIRADGETLTATADELMHATAVNLHGGGFADVVTTAEVLTQVADEE